MPAPGGGAPGGIAPGGIAPGGAMAWPWGSAPIPPCWAPILPISMASTSGGVSMAASSPTIWASSMYRASTERISPRRVFIKISGFCGVRAMGGISSMSAFSSTSSSISSMSKPDMMPEF